MTPDRPLRQVGRDEAIAVVDMVTLAFVNDPVARFWWPAAHDYLYWWPRFVRALFGRALDCGGADLIDGAGAAMWLAPGIEADPAALAQVDALPGPAPHVPTLQPHYTFNPEAVSEKLRTEMARFHPDQPHWYLGAIGTDPNTRGKGVGRQLMEHRLAMIDDAGEIAYLEASRPELVPFYSRFGFELVGTIDASPVPPLFAMLREPR